MLANLCNIKSRSLSVHSIFGFVFSVPRKFTGCVVVVFGAVENGDIDFLCVCVSLPAFASFFMKYSSHNNKWMHKNQRKKNKINYLYLCHWEKKKRYKKCIDNLFTTKMRNAQKMQSILILSRWLRRQIVFFLPTWILLVWIVGMLKHWL